MGCSKAQKRQANDLYPLSTFTSGAWGSVSVGLWGACQLSLFLGGGSSQGTLSTPPPPKLKARPPGGVVGDVYGQAVCGRNIVLEAKPDLVPNPQPRVQPNLLPRWQPSLQPSLQLESPFLWPLLSKCSSSASNTPTRKSGTQSLFLSRAKHASQRAVSGSFCCSCALVSACLVSCASLA